jgi:hypothetical protein
LKATIFVNPEFVDSRDVLRPQVSLDGTDDASRAPAACCAGFLSWRELKAMEDSGLVDVQSRSLTHNWYFKGPRVVDFWRPGAATESLGPVWMLWNQCPDRKPYDLTEAAADEEHIPYGTPIYERGKSLETRRFYPDDDLGDVLPAFVRDNGGRRFFDRPAWRAGLLAAVQRHRKNPGSQAQPGRHESDADYAERVRYELAESKRIIEERLDKRITAICQPGGGVNEQVLQTARDLGYTRFTLPGLLKPAHRAGRYQDLTSRMGSKRRLGHGKQYLGEISPRQFVWMVGATGGSRSCRWALKSVLAKRLLGAVVRGRRAAPDDMP